MTESDVGRQLQRSVKWLAVATVTLYLVLIGVGIYVYSFSRQAKQIQQNTDRLNAAVAAACEIGIAPDKDEPFVVHQLATGQLLVESQDCEVIFRKLKETGQ